MITKKKKIAFDLVNRVAPQTTRPCSHKNSNYNSPTSIASTTLLLFITSQQQQTRSLSEKSQNVSFAQNFFILICKTINGILNLAQTGNPIKLISVSLSLSENQIGQVDSDRLIPELTDLVFSLCSHIKTHLPSLKLQTFDYLIHLPQDLLMRLSLVQEACSSFHAVAAAAVRLFCQQPNPCAQMLQQEIASICKITDRIPSPWRFVRQPPFFS